MTRRPTDPASHPAIARPKQDAAADSLPPALPGERRWLGEGDQRIAIYVDLPTTAPAAAATPLLLVHSVNAAASAYEVRPIYLAALGSRPLMAVELPGFGSSARPADPYTPAVMRDTVLRGLHELQRLGHDRPVDVLAVSLSCEFAALAALAEPAAFRSVALVSPTGLESRRLPAYEDGRTRAKPRLRAALERGPWADGLFRLLTGEKSMRMFLKGAWGSPGIDEGLLAYNLLSVAQPGARHAPYAFIGGGMFTVGVAHLYGRLTQPVWIAHGTRGSFAKYAGIDSVRKSSPWTVDRFDAGAMPYFEHPAAFMAAYERFLHGLPAGAPAVRSR